MSTSFKYSGVIYDSPTASQVDFALTTSGGDNIAYLDPDHIHVYTSTDSGKTWTEITRGTGADEWDFKSDDPKIVRFVTAPGTSKDVRLLRITPYQVKYTTFQEGSLLTSNQLNDGEDFSMYVDQELFDETLKIRSQGGSSPNVISTAEQLAGSPSWDNEDGKVPTAGAAASRFDQIVGNGTSYPGTGNKGQRGKIRIDNTVTPQKMFWWDESLSTPAWVEIKTEGQKGDTGPQGPKGDKGDKGDPGKDGTGAGTVTAVKGGAGIASDGSTSTPTVSVDLDASTPGLEFSGSGETQKLKAKVKSTGGITLDGDGLSVTTPFSEPTGDNGNYLRKKDGTTFTWEKDSGGSGTVTGVSGGPGITVNSDTAATPKVSVEVDTTLEFDAAGDAGKLKVKTPFVEPTGDDANYVRKKDGTSFSWVKETSSSGVPDVTTQGRFVREQAADGGKSWTAAAPADAEKNVQSDWGQTTTTADDFIKNKPTIPAASPWTRATGTPNVVSPATAADTVSTRSGPLLTSQVVDAVQTLNTANGNNQPNFQTSNTVRLSAAGMTIQVPTNPQVGQSGIFQIDANATITAWANNYHFPENTRLTTKTGVVVIPFYVQTAGATPVILMGAATEDMRNA